MLPTPEGKVWVYQSAVDLRKSYYSLCAVVEDELKQESMTGDAFVFINRNKTLAKVIWWDRTGWCLLAKRLSSGRYRVTSSKKIAQLELKQMRIFFDGM